MVSYIWIKIQFFFSTRPRFLLSISKLPSFRFAHREKQELDENEEKKKSYRERREATGGEKNEVAHLFRLSGSYYW